MAVLLHPPLSRRILIVMPAIKLDDQPLCWTKEVYDIRAYRRLPSEVRALDRQLLQRTPQHALMRRRIRPQFLRRRTADSC